MILQQLQFPRIGESERELYLRFYESEGILDSGGQSVAFKAGSKINFNTYFNSFSWAKWKKYTILENLYLSVCLRGCCEVILSRFELSRDGADWEEYPLYAERINAADKMEFKLPVPRCHDKGSIAFKLYALTDTVFYGGAYGSDADDSRLPEVNLALCICTYKRESYVRQNRRMLVEQVFANETAMLRKHLYVYLVDNGQTLKREDIEMDGIKLLPNINSGGSGGFSRGMLEALADRERHRLTHVILMDDDVSFTPYALERTYTFLRMLKPEIGACMLGGAMLNISRPAIQYAAGEIWRVHHILYNNKVGSDLRLPEEILKNEIEESINTLSWWYCCFPLTTDIKSNLSLPLFYQGDDIDFCFRNPDMVKITLNGICVWHEPFEKKVSAVKEYYVCRNFSIVSSIHGNRKNFTPFILQKTLVKKVVFYLLLYRYKSASLMLRAAEDFLKGLEWLSKCDPQSVNEEISQMAETMMPLQKLSVPFRYREYLKNLTPVTHENPVKRWFRMVTCNGWLFTAKGDVTVPAAFPIKAHLYRARRILNYDVDMQHGFVTEKSWKEVCSVLWRLIKILMLIKLKFNQTVKRNRAVYPDLITEKFWRNYLKM